MISHITPVLIAKDAATTIENTLISLRHFQEVILYLNDTSDNTKEIASNFSNVKVIDGEFSGFGPTKNKASQYASNDWILSLDSDEVLEDDFVENLTSLDLDQNSVYQILRVNYYKTTQVKHCWGNDIITRLYHKASTQFCDKKVHEYVIEDNKKVLMLEGLVRHYPYNSITDFIIKLDRYSTIFAQDNVGKKNSSPLKAALNAKFSFIKTYFFKRGFLDGYAGLVIAFSHMATNFYKYIKLYELNKENKK